MRRMLITVAAIAGIAIVGTRSTAADLPPIKIGLIDSYTGTPPYIAAGFDAAIKAWIDQHGDTVAGRKIEFIRRDDQSQPEVARRVAQELIVQENVDILAGIGITPNAIAVAQVSTQAKKPFLISNAATSGILANAPYTVRFGFTTRQITVPLAQWALRYKMTSAFSVVQDYGPGLDAEATFAQAFTDGGGKMLGSLRVPVSSRDDSAYVQRIRDAKPKVAFTFFNLTGARTFLNSAEQTGLLKSATKIVSADDLVDENDLDTYGDGIVGLVSSGNYTSTHDSALNHAFVKAFGVAYGGDGKRLPDFTNCAIYDIMNAIYRVVAAQKGVVDPEKTMALLKGMKIDSPRGPLMIDPVTRDAVQNVYIKKVLKRNGKLATIEIETIPMVRDSSER
jgi:branched-chain amino acid transport system substrate-binding protein